MKERKKILIYTTGLTFGGTETIITTIANKLCEKYNVVLVLNYNLKIDYKLNKKIKLHIIDNDNTIYYSKMKKLINKISNKRKNKLKQIIEYEQPNVIFSFLEEPSIRSLQLKKYFKNIPIAIFVRNNPKKEFKYLKLIRNYYYNYADKIILQSKYYKKYFPKKFQNKIEIIPNFIREEFFKDNNTNIKNKIITVSRLEKSKNIELLIKSFKIVLNKNPNYKLYIFGTGSKYKKLNSLINKLRLENKVFLMDTTKNIKKELDDSKLFVLPSNYEGMPNALLEAMASKICVISTNSTECIKEFIHDGYNGYIIEKNNIDNMVEKINYVLNNQDIIDKFSSNGFKISKKYDIINIYPKWEKIIEELVV